MIRRTFLQSLLSGIGLGCFLPKAKAKPYVVPTMEVYERHLTDLCTMTFHHEYQPKITTLDNVVVNGLKDGRPICQLMAQHATIVERQYGAAAKSGKDGEIVWKSPHTKKEIEVSLSGLFGPSPLQSVLVSIFGDVTQCKNMSLALVVPDEQQRIDISYALLCSVGSGVGATGCTFYTGATFIGKTVEHKNDQWNSADLEFPRPLEGLGMDWVREQERLLNNQIDRAVR